MQWNRISGKHYKLQGKQGKQPGHGVIIAFPIGYHNLFGGKVVIITGASEGIGAHLVAAFLAHGAKVAAAARNEARLRAVAGDESENTLIIPGNLTEPAVQSAAVYRTVERWGQIDILINNAGRGSYFAPSAAPIDDARSLFDLNFFTPLALSQLATPYLRESRGTIVNICSIAAQIPLPWLPVYSASKAALASLSSTQRIELRGAGVNVLCVYPGYVGTEFQAHASGSRPPERVVQGKRWSISPEGCAAAVIEGIAARKKTVVTPRSGWPLVLAHRLFPAFVESRLEGV